MMSGLVKLFLVEWNRKGITMKKIIHLLLTIIILLNSICVIVNANDDITVKLNGQKIYFDQQPIIRNNRTLVPMRAIFEAMGCEVEWDDGVIDVYKDDENIMTLWVDDPEMWTLEKDYFYIDVPPIVMNDRTLVPIRVSRSSVKLVSPSRTLSFAKA